MPDVIDFVYNWNNKLDCDAFTTIRLRNDLKYKPGNEFYVNLKQHNHNTNKGLHRCADVKHIKLNQITPFIAYLDTGLPVEKAKEKITAFYKNYNPPIDWETKELSFILLVKVKTGN